MHRIDTPGATLDGRFTEGNPGTGQPATVLGADWPNAVQEEIVAVLTAAGIVPNKPTTTQLRDAIVALIAGAGADLTPYLKKDGTVAMTGLLTLSGNAVNALHSVPKQQLDAAIAAATGGGPFLPLAGGILTGALELAADPAAALQAATRQYVDGRDLTPWLKTVNAAAVASAAVIPRDDTMPQSGEGTEILSLGPVAVAAGQAVELDALVHVLVNDIEACAFIIRSGTADAIQTGYASHSGGATFLHSIPLKWIDEPGAGNFTYSVRFGPLGSGTAWLNSSDNVPTRIHGGAAKSLLRLRVGRA